MDSLIKAIASHGAIRILVADTTELVQEAVTRHQTLPTASAALGRTLTATAMLGSMLKGKEEKITVQINGGGPLGTLLADANGCGEVRGFAANPDVLLINEKTGKLDVGKAVGNQGTLKVIRHLSMKSDFTGTVDLQTGEIAEDFAYYFTVSEQTPSAVSLGVLIGEKGEVLAAGGLIIQLLPEAQEIDILMTEDVVKNMRPISAMIADEMTPTEIASKMFDDVQILTDTPLIFKCTCSRERMQEAIHTLERDQIEEMIRDDHGAEITCQFCNTHYHFNESELAALITHN